ncbi:MAG: AAA family ATPase [Bacteroidia bacterium]|nr:AAA family ATPase [Bacteroidia bacterium]
MIPRQLESDLLYNLRHLPAVALLGPRQVGKTTLVQAIRPRLERESVYLDLENPADRASIRDRALFLEIHQDHTVILDEVHKLPDLFFRSFAG